MRIAMVTETYPPEVNGVARTVGRMVDGLRQRGHSVQVVRPRQNGHDVIGADELLQRGFPIPRYPQLMFGAPAGGALQRAWSEQRPDIVHIVTEGPLGWSALAAARKRGLKVSTGFHTNFQSYTSHYGVGFLAGALTAYLRYFHNRADCTLVPTQEMAEDLRGRGYRGLRVVGRGVEHAVFSPQRRSRALRATWGAGDDTLVAICVSRFAPEKNFPLVIRAYEAMRALRHDAKLVLLGDGPMADELRRRNVGIIIAGRKLDEELAAHYASADVFLFPSTTETFGNVTLEAMASGLGIVAYRYAAAREHLEHERSALLVPLGDESAFLAAAMRMASDPGLACRLGSAARQTAESLPWERIVGDFEEALHDVAV
jgi:glycosyltransferase involved in cell wall biosynthesis